MKVNKGPRLFSKATCFFTLLLIFWGGMVTSTGSGLSVPDWPLSYGMLNPPLIGGVLYEHTHRQFAAIIGLLTLILAVWLHRTEERRWVIVTGYAALGMVIVQGLFGGLTVLLMLPDWTSVTHGVLAQTFFLLTIFLAYSQSRERTWRADMPVAIDLKVQRSALMFCGIVYLQLIFAAVMRHTDSGMAIYDFPTMGGQWIPALNQDFVHNINMWYFDEGSNYTVTMGNVIFHLIHRVGALIVCLFVIHLNIVGRQCTLPNRKQIFYSIWIINILVFFQVCLGIASIWTQREPIMTSLHVMGGATILGLSFLLLLRSLPTSTHDVRWQ